MKFSGLIMLGLLTSFAAFGQTGIPEIDAEIEIGNFKKAARIIDSLICYNNALTSTQIYDLNFQKEIMDRIRLDFRKSIDDILPYIQNYFMSVNEDMIKKWEKEKTLEYKIIDGEKKYFNNAHYNLFRLDADAKNRKIKIDGPKEYPREEVLRKHLPKVVENSIATQKPVVEPVEMLITYTLTVKPNVVPDGEIIRCWLPYPREGHARQTDIKLISTNVSEYVIADNSHLQRTIYMEKVARADVPTVFNFTLSYKSYAEWYDLSVEKVLPYMTDLEFYREFTQERPPHIVFSEPIRNLSKALVGSETNPYIVFQKLYEWVDRIPWASALEYSTIPNIPEYCLEYMHGDCGQQTLLLMTLLRFNGIPTKWQSGWMMHPGEVNLHDWCEVYFENYGWVPLDQSFGLRESDDPKIANFYKTGIDAYRLIVNDDYSKPLYPAKIYPRSETIDFQRGELEWRGGNLYFDKWNYKMEVIYLSGD